MPCYRIYTFSCNYDSGVNEQIEEVARSINKVADGIPGRSDHFDWLSGYLQRRGLGPTARRLLALVGVLLTLLLPLNVLWGAVSISRPAALAISLCIVIGGLAAAALWWSNWPTRSQSLVLGIAGSIATGAWCLLQANPMFGLLACAVLVIPGGYIALFHSDRYIAFTCALAVLVGGFEATRLFLNGQAVIAVTGGIIVLELNIGVPLAFLLVVRALMADLMHADTDPLTGLLNRRAFTHAAVRRVQAATEDASLTVAVVDLDRFKAVNDSFGHAGGDAALVAVAGALRSVSGDTALLCRMGGEEFVVADVTTGTTSAEAPTHWGKRLRDAVAAIEFPVTASVGIATTAVGDVRAATAEQVLQHMVAEADEAMYCAKRRGGNQAYHAGQNANN